MSRQLLISDQLLNHQYFISVYSEQRCSHNTKATQKCNKISVLFYPSHIWHD